MAISNRGGFFLRKNLSAIGKDGILKRKLSLLTTDCRLLTAEG